ncbi:MAG: peroxidase-related enzyme [Salinibacter sp.]
MAWIDTIAPNDADGELAEIYDEIAGARGGVANILQAHSLNPDALRDHVDLYQTLLFGRSNLNRAEREALAVVVSAANDCEYCVRHHAEALAAYWDEPRVEQLAADSSSLDDLSPKLRAACDFAVALTAEPGDPTEADVKHLRDAGWSDRDVLDIALITSYFNFVNRLATGLGVEVTEAEATGYDY